MYAVAACRGVFEEKEEVTDNDCKPEALRYDYDALLEEDGIVELDAAALEWEWTQPYLGTRHDDGSPVQACLRAFDKYWKEQEDDSFDSVAYLEGNTHEQVCYQDGEVLANCRYCDEFQLRDEEKRAKIEQLRLVATGVATKKLGKSNLPTTED